MMTPLMWRSEGAWTHLPLEPLLFLLMEEADLHWKVKGRGVERGLGKAAVRRETRNIWRTMQGGAAARRPFPRSVVSDFSHRVGYSSCLGPSSFPSQWLLPQHSTLNAL